MKTLIQEMLGFMFEVILFSLLIALIANIFGLDLFSLSSLWEI